LLLLMPVGSDYVSTRVRECASELQCRWNQLHNDWKTTKNQEVPFEVAEMCFQPEFDVYCGELSREQSSDVSNDILTVISFDATTSEGSLRLESSRLREVSVKLQLH
jgi:hypothetical protein